ncbi:MAG: FAD-binding domain-containing protein, partial [Bacteroidota bacterium]
DVELQAKKYDPEATFIRHWLPELATLPPELARAPYRMTGAQQAQHGVRIGEDYPTPVLDYYRVTDRLRDRSRNGAPQRSRNGKRR